MSLFLLPFGSWDIRSKIFRFDALISVSRVDSWRRTRKAIESLGEFSDFAVKEPRQYTISGINSAWSMSAVDPGFFSNPLKDVHDVLLAYADTKQPVFMLYDIWSDDVVITKIDAKIAASDGEMLSMTITLESYQVATFSVAEIPPEILAADVADSASSDSGAGGVGVTDVASEADNRTVLAKGFDYAEEVF